MNKALIALLLSISVVACSPMSVIKSLNPFDNNGINVDAQVGKENTQQNAAMAVTEGAQTNTDSNITKETTGIVLGATTENKVITDQIDTSVIAETQTTVKSDQIDTSVISETQTTIKANNSEIKVSNIFNNIPPWVLILLILGWILPTPTTIFNSFVSWRKERKNQAKLDSCLKKE